MLGVVEGLRSKLGFVRSKVKGEWRGVGFCGGRVFDSIYSFMSNG